MVSRTRSLGTRFLGRIKSLSTTGLLFALLFASLSLTPSLVPRSAAFMGLLAGLWGALGYGFGLVIKLLLSLPSDESLIGRARAAVARFGVRVRRDLPPLPWRAVMAVAAFFYAVGYGAVVVNWQNEVRALVEMPPLDGVSVGTFALTSLIGFALVAGIGMWLRTLQRKGAAMVRSRGAGRTAATLASLGTILVGSLLTLAVVAGLGVFAVNRIYSASNERTTPGTTEPASTYRSTGAGSAVAWEGLGSQGRDFLGKGPSAADIETVTRQPAKEPIRVYAGLGNADTLEGRAALAVQELKRTRAFDRKVLVVATPTGSGWLEPQGVDSIEYLYGGDTAIAAIQYSYAPSWVSFLFAPDVAGEAARALFTAVRAEWATLPEAERPKLVVYGLSLGAMGGQAGLGSLDAILTQTDGALFCGPPNASRPWRDITYSRDAGSPIWQPVYQGGERVRFMSKNGDLAKVDGEWTMPRVVYQQHATDAVTWLDPKVIWQRPEWLSGSVAEGGRAPDVTDSMIWVPGVTYLHLVADMMLGLAPPAGHGHNYGDVIVAGWEGILPDHGLDATAVGRVQMLMETYPFEGETTVWE